MAFHAEESLSDGESLTETIVKYAERASLAELKVSELEGRLAMLEMGSNNAKSPHGYIQQHQMQTAYFTPAPPVFQAPMTQTTTAFRNPHQQGSARWQSGECRGYNTGKRRNRRGHNTYNGQQWQQDFGANPNAAYHQGGQSGYPPQTHQRWQPTGHQGHQTGQRRKTQQFGNKNKEHQNILYGFS